MAQIETYKPFNPKIYAYITLNISDNEGWIKIGYTEHDVMTRINQQAKTIRAKTRCEWYHSARFDDGETFKDTHFHKYLTGVCGVERSPKTEWFHIDSATAERYFYQFRRREHPKSQPPKTYALRDEQLDAVERTLNYFHSNDTPREFLWNAKPRFGKTLTAYDFVCRLNLQHVLIVTNRPSIANSWFDDFNKFVAHKTGYKFVCNGGNLEGNSVITYDKEFRIPRGAQIIAFLSLQDLKGSKYFCKDSEKDDKVDKLEWIAKTRWDLLIVDEAHEGVYTDKTKDAFKKIKRGFTLYLSGTPFKAIANNDFRDDQIFNWSYEEEQIAKENFTAEPNPYADLPRMNMFSYRIPQATIDKVNRGVNLGERSVDYAFDLNEFFKTNADGKFIYESEVNKFLDDLANKKDFPFSPAFRDQLNHTFWLMNHVADACAMAELLHNHPVFRDYFVVVAAGKNFIDNDDDIRDSYTKVTKAIASHDKTITLSVGQLTTGVTIPGWTGVLMLSNLKSAAAYMQAAFRAQNPHVDKTRRKENCYVFDFAPERTLLIYDEFANNLKPGNSTDRSKNIAELLNFFPVISENDSGAMTPLNAESFTSTINKIKISRVVKNKFIDNNLFANVSHVFGSAYEQEIVDVLDKLAPDDTSPDDEPPKIEIIKPQGVKLGDKIAPAARNPKPDKSERDKVIDTLVKDIAKIFADDINRTGFSKKQITRLKADSNHRVRQKLSALETFPHPAIQKIVNAERLELAKAINAVSKTNIQKNFDDQVRAHLRGFARTIPSFIMAYCAEARARGVDITLKNFETIPDDKTFIEVTSITKEEFRLLRDRKLFSETIFNGAIQEFLRLKAELADYFTGTHDKDIFDYIPPQRTNQIFTPKHVVTQMVDALEAENPGIFDNPAQKFFDPYMKSGMFIAHIVKRLYHSPVLAETFPDSAERLKHILTRQVYGCAPTEIIYRISTEYIFGATASHISRRNFLCASRLEVKILDKPALEAAARKQFGEVFTPNNIVEIMVNFDDIQLEIKSLHSKFLEPATGEAAFLTKILSQKLEYHVPDATAPNWIYKMLWIVAGLYGIEIQPKNVDAARANLKNAFAEHFQKITGKPLDANSPAANALNALVDANILLGDATNTNSSLQFSFWLPDDEDIQLARRRAFPYSAFFTNDLFNNSFDESEMFNLLNVASQKFETDNTPAIEDALREVIVICNPPYQGETTGDNKTFAKPVYHTFLNNFHESSDKVIMIHPARCLFNAGATPKDFNTRILSDEHLKVVKYFPNSTEVFPNAGVNFNGGVAITYRDVNRIFGAIGTFIPNEIMRSTYEKVIRREDFKPLSEIISPAEIYHFTEQFHVENPTAEKRLSKGHAYDLKSSVFENLPDIFLDDKPDDGREYIQIIGWLNRDRAFKWIRRDYIRDIPELHIHKVFIPAAYGTGSIYEKGPNMLVGLPLVGLPLVGNTQTFITLCTPAGKAEAEAAMKFVKTKFARAMLGILKVTQHNPPDKWRYVPQQDFSAGSDVDWSLPVAQIDEYLYKKYGLSKGEVAFIEANVKAMD